MNLSEASKVQYDVFCKLFGNSFYEFTHTRSRNRTRVCKTKKACRNTRTGKACQNRGDAKTRETQSI